MGQILHGSATTTHAIRAAIQRSKASIAALNRTYGINPKTVQKWRKRATVEDRKTGPRTPRSTTPAFPWRRHFVHEGSRCDMSSSVMHLS